MFKLIGISLILAVIQISGKFLISFLTPLTPHSQTTCQQQCFIDNRDQYLINIHTRKINKKKLILK